MSPSRPRNGHAPALEGLRVVARDRRLRLLVGVLSVSTLLEGMIDVLVVVTALHLVNLGDAGAGWLNAAWGIGGIAGGVLALRLLARGRLGALAARRRDADRAAAAAAGQPAGRGHRARGAARARRRLRAGGVGRDTLLQRLAHDGVRARAFAVVESSYWLTTGAGAMLAPAVIALAGVARRAGASSAPFCRC